MTSAFNGDAMKKIISLFQRNYDGDRLVRDEVVPGAEWVLAGEGVPTRKFDGTCCMIREGQLYKRHEVKKGKATPANFEAAQEPEAVTGNIVGWVPVGDGPEDRWHREAFEYRNGLAIQFGSGPLRDGTFELVGPKIQGNPEGYNEHDLVRHGDYKLGDALAADSKKWDRVPRTFEGLKEYFGAHNIEGIVWHHPDGRMVKIKAKDFGLKRILAERGRTTTVMP